MSLWYPRMVSAESASGTDLGETITGDSTAHVKGAWTQIQAALPFNGFFAAITAKDVRTASSTETKVVCDIGVDPAGGTSYTVYVPNILFGYVQSGSNLYSSFGVPVFIPAGSTVAARIQGLLTSETARIGAFIYGGTPPDEPFPIQGPVIDYGVTTSSSSGVNPTNALADIEGAWTEIIDATTHPHRGVSVALQGDSTTLSTTRGLVDIAIGAGGSEVPLYEGVYYVAGSSEFIMGPSLTPPIERPIPEGSRLSVRLQTTLNNQGSNCELALYGWG